MRRGDPGAGHGPRGTDLSQARPAGGRCRPRGFFPLTTRVSQQTLSGRFPRLSVRIAAPVPGKGINSTYAFHKLRGRRGRRRGRVGAPPANLRGAGKFSPEAIAVDSAACHPRISRSSVSPLPAPTPLLPSTHRPLPGQGVALAPRVQTHRPARQARGQPEVTQGCVQAGELSGGRPRDELGHHPCTNHCQAPGCRPRRLLPGPLSPPEVPPRLGQDSEPTCLTSAPLPQAS